MYFQPKIDFSPEELIFYLRKSRSDDPALTVEEVLAKHEAMLNDWVQRNLGAPVPEDNKYREVVSGETIAERPEINRVLRLIESPRYKAVAVVEPQRLTRGDLEDIGRMMKLLKHTNTIVVTPQRIYDLHDEYDWDAFERELKRGNEYLEYTKKILARGRMLSVSQGNYLGKVPPYGYDKTYVMDGNRKCPTLVPNKEQADVVRLVFDMYANQNKGSTTIAHELDKLGVKPNVGEHWSGNAIIYMLQNPHYIGKVVWNRRRGVTIVEDGEFKVTHPVADDGDYLICDGRHEGIVPEELFTAAQKKRGMNTRKKHNTSLRNPFSGMLRCKCGYSMSHRTYSDGKPPRLQCNNHTRCKTGSCTVEELTELIIGSLTDAIKDFEIRAKDDQSNAIKLHAQIVANLEARRKLLDEKELAQWEAQADPDPAKRMPQHIFQRLNEKLLREKEDVRQALEEAYRTAPEPIDYDEKIMLFTQAVDALRSPDVSAEAKNKLLKKCIVRIDYDRKAPERIESKRTRYYDKERKCTRCKSPLARGANWTTTEISVDVTLRF